jgi:hypothetical protein
VIGVGIVAHPAIELFAMRLGVDTMKIFIGDAIKTVSVPDFISLVTIRTLHHRFETQFVRMGKAFAVGIGVAIRALKVPVIRLIEFGRVNNVIWVHPFPYIMSKPFVVIAKILMPVTNHAFLVLFHKCRRLVFLLCTGNKSRKGDECQQGNKLSYRCCHHRLIITYLV